MSTPRLYHDLAQWFPVLSRPEDYAEEMTYFRDTLREKLGLGSHWLLDLGTGSGHHLSHLTNDFKAVAVDRSEQMLAHSERLNPGVEHHLGDMRTVRLGRRFNAVIIHDAVGYLLSEHDVVAALKTAAAHLEPSGVLIITPDWFRETFPDQFVWHTTRRSGDTDFTYIEYVHDPDPADSTVEIVMFFLIREKGQLRIEQDKHTMGLLSQDTWIKLMEQAGFKPEPRPYVQADYGKRLTMLVGTLQSEHH